MLLPLLRRPQVFASFIPGIIQPPCGPSAYTFKLWRRNKHEKQRNRKKLQQQAKANNPRVFLGEPAEKKRRKKLYSVVQGQAGASIQVPGTNHIKDTFGNQPQENWRWALLPKAATARDGCVAHMLPRSCRDVRRPRQLPNAATTTILQSHPDGTKKKQILYGVVRRPPVR